MTSRSISGGNEQSIGSLHRGSTHDYLPQFKTWCSASVELAPSLCIPPASKVLPSVARSAQQEDRALIKWLSDASFIIGLTIFILCSAASIPLALFMIFFCRF